MSAKVHVLEHNQALTDEPRFRYERKVAKDLVERGLAVWIDRFTIQRTPPGVQVKNGDSEKNLSLRRQPDKIKSLHFPV